MILLVQLLYFAKSHFESGGTIDNIGFLHDRHSFFNIDPLILTGFTALSQSNGTASEERHHDPDKHKNHVYQCANPRGNLEHGMGTNILGITLIDDIAWQNKFRYN